MSPLTLKAAAVQMAPLFLDTQGTLGKILQYIEEGAGQGLELLVFPETILPGYPYWSMTHDPMLNLGRFNQRLHAEAVVVPGFESKALCAAAKKHHCNLVVGINEKEGGTIYNSQLIISNDGELLGCRRKLVPTSQERMVWGRGDGSDLKVYQTSSGRAGSRGELARWYAVYRSHHGCCDSALCLRIRRLCDISNVDTDAGDP